MAILAQHFLFMKFLKAFKKKNLTSSKADKSKVRHKWLKATFLKGTMRQNQVS